MQLPIRTFWLLNSSVPRLMAEKDVRGMRLMGCVRAGGDSLSEFRDSLVLEMGEVVTLDPIVTAVRDEAGVARLKALAGQQKT